MEQYTVENALQWLEKNKICQSSLKEMLEK